MQGGLNEDPNGGDLARNQHQSKIYSQLKPSGKIKFMSAYRFFRKEMVPLIKRLEPDLDSKGRHHVVHNVWTQLHDQHKLAYVLMSRADREKSLYIIRLNQILSQHTKENGYAFNMNIFKAFTFTKNLNLPNLYGGYK